MLLNIRHVGVAYKVIDLSILPEDRWILKPSKKNHAVTRTYRCRAKAQESGCSLEDLVARPESMKAVSGILFIINDFVVVLPGVGDHGDASLQLLYHFSSVRYALPLWPKIGTWQDKVEQCRTKWFPFHGV